MKLKTLIVAITLSILAQSANALFISCERKWIAKWDKNTLQARMTWDQVDYDVWPQTYFFTSINLPGNVIRMLRSSFNIQDAENDGWSARLHRLRWSEWGIYRLASQGSSWDPDDVNDVNPDVPECSISSFLP